MMTLVAVLVLTSCAALRDKKVIEVCPSTGASSFVLNITGFVDVPLKAPFPRDEKPSQIQLTDSVISGGKLTLSNHLALVFSKEIENIKSKKKVVPAASLCCRWDEDKEYFLSDGEMQSVLWAYGKQATTPKMYYDYWVAKSSKRPNTTTDNRILAYANYERHVIWDVHIPEGKKSTLDCFQMLVQQKAADGTVTSKLVFVVGMGYSDILSLIAKNTNGLVFELSDVVFDARLGKWRPAGEFKGTDKTVYTFAWNAQGANPLIKKEDKTENPEDIPDDNDSDGIPEDN